LSQWLYFTTASISGATILCWLKFDHAYPLTGNNNYRLLVLREILQQIIVDGQQAALATGQPRHLRLQAVKGKATAQ